MRYLQSDVPGHADRSDSDPLQSRGHRLYSKRGERVVICLQILHRHRISRIEGERNMSVLNLAISLGILYCLAKGIRLFTRHCRGRFGRSFFSIRGFWLAMIAINSLWWGYNFWVTAPWRHAPPSGGLILLAI